MHNDQPQVKTLLETAAEVPPLPRRLLLLLLLMLLASSEHASATTVAESLRDSNCAPISATIGAQPVLRTAFWPFDPPRAPAVYDSLPYDVTPHPAVARIIVPERGATAFGSGTLVDVRENYGLVVTNWHVVRDSEGTVEVVFGNGFRSHARPLKVDSNWDLAALVIWRPTMEPVRVAAQPPQPGDLLTIHGYGKGKYRIATGRCTGYYAPHNNFPMEMLELDVEARQGDSGGPIFNQRGELAGVLFGAGQGTTLGSYAPRVSNFLATLAPDIGQANDQAKIAVADRPAPNVSVGHSSKANSTVIAANDVSRAASVSNEELNYPSSPWSPVVNNKNAPTDVQKTANSKTPPSAFPFPPSNTLYERLKSAFAVIGIAAIALKLVKSVG